MKLKKIMKRKNPTKSTTESCSPLVSQISKYSAEMLYGYKIRNGSKCFTQVHPVSIYSIANMQFTVEGVQNELLKFDSAAKLSISNTRNL